MVKNNHKDSILTITSKPKLSNAKLEYRILSPQHEQQQKYEVKISTAPCFQNDTIETKVAGVKWTIHPLFHLFCYVMIEARNDGDSGQCARAGGWVVPAWAGLCGVYDLVAVPVGVGVPGVRGVLEA